ncbi:GNAT family N-acetyltransferase [Chelatococcus sp. SYSU_G07232]|uniref:GNAT family N-acetyltransferase n=1 Tax=Chelatococcus albus TaxID=3047466 RepID=A0ABT7ABD5_9HYPH|nr:GNAT family N-acetyltransferase [Chelatococcus sp. SYSU_G07232]MDJ1156673.1 GNAT family N-acetyltransferase [Chelatococcus sp. SYSU_G07232]
MGIAHRTSGETAFTSFNAEGAGRVTTLRSGGSFVVQEDGRPLVTLALEAGGEGRLALRQAGTEAPDTQLRAALAGFEALFALEPQREGVALDADSWAPLRAALLRSGAALAGEGGGLEVRASLLWQLPQLWLRPPLAAPFPPHHVLTAGRRHPLRAPKPEGEVYARHIPWLGQTLTFRAATLDADLARLNRWMNDPRVAAVWNEEGDIGKHRAYLAGLITDPHMLPLVGCFDGVPFGYFEVYWAKENRLGPFYDAEDYDRGWHVLIGEEAYRGRQWIAAWLPSLMHYLFLDDCRTQRIVGEPRADHHQQIRNLDKAGFAKVKQFDFPHKRALLVMLLRERFFSDRLWNPAAEPEPPREGAGAAPRRVRIAARETALPVGA